MSITPFRLAGALLIAAALGTASVGARVQQTSKPAPRRNPRRSRSRDPARQGPADAARGAGGPTGRRGPARARSAAAADLPHRHQLRSRRRHRHRQEGRAGHRPEPEGLSGLGRRQAAGRRVVQAVQDRRADPDDAGAADPIELRRGVRSAAPGRPAVCLLPRRLSRPPRQRHARAHRARRFRAHANRAAGHGRHHVPADADRRRRHGPQSRERWRGRSRRSTAGSTTTRRATSSKISTRTIRRRSSSRCATTSRCRR